MQICRRPPEACSSSPLWPLSAPSSSGAPARRRAHPRRARTSSCSDDSVKSPASAATSEGLSPSFVYQYALKGYAAQMTADKASALAASSNVRFVEPDGVVQATTTRKPGDVGARPHRPAQPAARTISTRTPRRARASRRTSSTPGIRITHNEFGGRASVGDDEIGDGNGPDCKGGTVGDSPSTATGHTSPARVGSATYGVAKARDPRRPSASLDCFGSGSDSG